MNPLILRARATGMSLILFALAACSQSPQSPRQIASSKPSSSNDSPRTVRCAVEPWIPANC